MRHSFVARPRILALIESAAARRATFVCAPQGYGKTALLLEYASRVPSAYLALPKRASFARFVGDLARVVAGHAPGISLSFAGAYERALQRSDPAETLAQWFVGHVGDAACTIAIDDLHHGADEKVARFLVSAIERSPSSLRWLVGTESIDENIPISSWLAHGVASLPIGVDELQLDLPGAKKLAQRASSLRTAAEVERLHAATGGVLSDFVFLIRQPHAEDETNFERAAARTFASFDAMEREFVFRSMLLPALALALLERLDGPPSGEILKELRRTAPQIFEDDGIRYHSGFREFARVRLDALPEAERAEYVLGAARALESVGDVAGSLQILVERGDEAEIVRLVERHGFTWIEGEQAHVLHDALAAVGDEARQGHPSIMAVRAMIASLGGRYDVAESLFQRALSATDEPVQRLRIRYYYASDLMRRGRLDAIELLQPDETFFEAPVDLRIAVMSALGATYAIAGELELARKWVDRALDAVGDSRNRVLAARVHHQAAFVAMYAGDGQLAKRLAATASSLAEAVSAYEVAGGAYTVRYQLALDVDDDPRSAAAHLERVAAYGAKCGSVEKQLFAVAGAFEIAVERGDDEGVASLERELEQFDVQYSARTAMEGLLPAKALLLAGHGEFARAYRILNASADQQPTADRRAQRLAEIAVYAAGAGEFVDAGAAAVAAWRLTKQVPPHSIRSLRTRLFAALALVMLGRLSAPRMLVAGVRRDLPAGLPRLAAFVEAIEALIARRSGMRNHTALAAALETMHSLDFGGVARIVEALPSERVCAVGRPMREMAASA